MTARFFEEGLWAIVVALRFKSFNLDRGHRLGVGSFKGLQCEVAEYERVQREAGHHGMSV